MHRLHQNQRRHVHTHTARNGGFRLLYDNSTMAVIGMIRDLAHTHTDSLWIANNLQEQIGQTNEEKITSKRQNKSSLSPLAQCCVASTCPGACDAPAGPLGGLGRVYVGQERSHVQDLHTVVLCLCVLGRVCVRLRRPERLFILQVGLQKRGLIKNILFTGLWAVLHVYYSVVGLESLPQLDVDLALHVHEHQSASEAYGHHHQLGPKRPFQ